MPSKANAAVADVVAEREARLAELTVALGAAFAATGVGLAAALRR
jgi:hypothetical protein